MTLFDGTLVGARAVMAPHRFELPHGGANGAYEGRKLTFGVRPEDVVLAPGAPVEARIHDVENHGAEKILTLRVGDIFLHATAPARIAFGIDEANRLSWNPDKVLLFDRLSGTSLMHQT